MGCEIYVVDGFCIKGVGIFLFSVMLFDCCVVGEVVVDFDIVGFENYGVVIMLFDGVVFLMMMLYGYGNVGGVVLKCGVVEGVVVGVSIGINLYGLFLLMNLCFVDLVL